MKDHFGRYITPEEIEKSGIKSRTIRSRLASGWSKKKALTTPVKQRMLSEEFRIELTINGVTLDTYHKRRKRGWSHERAKSTPVATFVRSPIQPDMEKLKKYKISRVVFLNRVNVLGWSKEKAETTPPLNRTEVAKARLVARERKRRENGSSR